MGAHGSVAVAPRPVKSERSPIEASPAKDVATVTSFRMPPGELEQIRDAARAEGLTMSEWIRNACKAALGMPVPLPDRAHIIELLDVLRRTVEEADRTVKSQLG